MKNPLVEDDNTGTEGNPRTIHTSAWHVTQPAGGPSHLVRDIDSWMQSRGGFGSSSGRRALVGGWKFGGFVRHDEFSTGPQTITIKKKEKWIGRKVKRRLWQPDEDKFQTSD